MQVAVAKPPPTMPSKASSHPPWVVEFVCVATAKDTAQEGGVNSLKDMANKKRKSPSKKKKVAARSQPVRSKLSKDLERLVGIEVYSTWIKMLKELVPWGRTHRLSVLVAGMLQYASSCKCSSKDENAAAELLDESREIDMDYEEQEQFLMPIIEQLFKDAGVRWKRTNSRGQGYSIAEQTLEEFLRWDFMPWE